MRSGVVHPEDGAAWPGICSGVLIAWSALAAGVPSIAGDTPVKPPISLLATLAEAPTEQLPQVKITAPEPRYVAPTRRDRIGRIWAPCLINGQGPFRLVLDTGASHSGVTARVAAALGIPLDLAAPVLLHGVTGDAEVPSITVGSLTVGDLELKPAILPIVVDALGGADGVLGTEGLEGMRIFIDFRHDRIQIARSHYQRAGRGFVTIPMLHTHLGLPMFKAYVDGVAVKAVFDTGGEVTLGNEAMRQALLRRALSKAHPEQVVGVTDAMQSGESYFTPPIEFGAIRIRGARVTYGEMKIFEQWRLTNEPVLLVGMDAIGLLDTVVIDYGRKELQIRTRGG